MVAKHKISKVLSVFFLWIACSMSTFQGIPKVAIVGGGISGLSCARRLQTLGIESTVFDTGKKATGGRCSSRNLQVDGRTYVADHSSQFFTASSDRFRGELETFRKDETVIEWVGDIAQISGAGTKPVAILSETKKFVGRNGMGSFSKKMSENLDIKRPIWVSKMERCKVNPKKWKLYEYNNFLGDYDIVVIAHNGKCADRLLSTSDVPRIHNLLKVNFGDTLPPVSRMRKMQLCSLWVAVKGKLPLSYEGAYVSNCKTLSWMGNNTKKMQPKPSISTATATSSSTSSAVVGSDALAMDSFPPASFGPVKGKEQTRAAGTFSYASAASKGATTSTPATSTSAVSVSGKQTSSKHSTVGSKDSGSNDEVECWTLTSTREFGAANKVPQENVPLEKEREIASMMLRAMEQATGLSPGSIAPVACKVQLWGAAVPMNRHSSAFLVDGAAGVAVCGDWFTPSPTSTGPSIESAFLSGSYLADAISERFRGGGAKDHGLEPAHYFQACAAHPLGDVPTSGPPRGGAKGPALGSTSSVEPSARGQDQPKRVWVPKNTATAR